MTEEIRYVYGCTLCTPTDTERGRDVYLFSTGIACCSPCICWQNRWIYTYLQELLIWYRKELIWNWWHWFKCKVTEGLRMSNFPQKKHWCILCCGNFGKSKRTNLISVTLTIFDITAIPHMARTRIVSILSHICVSRAYKILFIIGNLFGNGDHDIIFKVTGVSFSALEHIQQLWQKCPYLGLCFVDLYLNFKITLGLWHEKTYLQVMMLIY